MTRCGRVCVPPLAEPSSTRLANNNLQTPVNNESTAGGRSQVELVVEGPGRRKGRTTQRFWGNLAYSELHLSDASVRCPSPLYTAFHTIHLSIRQINHFVNLSRRPVPGPRLRGRYNWWSNPRNVSITDTLRIPTGTKDPVVRFITIVIVQGNHVS